MCLTILRFRPDAQWPVVALSTRDEFVEREWDPPSRWWPGTNPDVIGGRDRQGGGTWLVAKPSASRFVVVYTSVRARGPEGPAKPSRGGVPLLVAEDGDLRSVDSSAYDDFAVLVADPRASCYHGARGAAPSGVEPGVHICNIGGLDAVATHHRQAYWLPLLREVDVSALDPDEVWAAWLAAIESHALPPDDRRAFWMRTRPSGRDYGTASATRIAVAADGGMRYEFCADPPSGDWVKVL